MRLMRFSQIILVSFLGLAAMSAYSQSGGVMAKVNGVAIPQARLDLMVKANVAQGQPDGPEMRKALRENLIA